MIPNYVTGTTSQAEGSPRLGGRPDDPQGIGTYEHKPITGRDSVSARSEAEEVALQGLNHQDAKMQAHPYADRFPMLESDDMQMLSEDIKKNGQREPIITHKGLILDGRNRHQACIMAGVEPRLEEYTGDDPLALVVSKNIHRRHLSPSQKSMLAEELINVQPGQRTDLVSRDTRLEPITRKRAAALASVSEASIGRARTVKAKGIPELVEAVKAGEVSVNTAAKLAALPKTDQPFALARQTQPAPPAEYSAQESKDDPQAKARADIGKRIIYIPEMGMEIADKAMLMMRRIADNDKEFEPAIQAVAKYCEERIRLNPRKQKTASSSTEPSTTETPGYSAPEEGKSTGLPKFTSDDAKHPGEPQNKKCEPPAQHDFHSVWIWVRDILDDMPSRGNDKNHIFQEVLEYTRKRLGSAYKPDDAVPLAESVIAYLDKMEQKSDDFTEAMACVAVYCAKRIIKDGLRFLPLSGRDSVRTMGDLSYLAMTLIPDDSPGAFNQLGILASTSKERMEQHPEYQDLDLETLE